MSGHSKWSTIKHKKAINDAKKGKIFSKLSVQLTLAARQGGADPNSNPALRLLVDEAKREGFPSDNIKKAIEKGAGQGAEGGLEEASYEGFGPHGVAIIVDVLTANTNRAVADLRNMFSDNGGNMGDSGAVSWNFDVVGWITIKTGKMVPAKKFGQEDVFSPLPKDEVELAVMDLEGVMDIVEEEENTLEIIVDFKKLGSVRDAILNMGYVVEKAKVAKVAKNKKELSKEEFERVLSFIEAIEEYEDVQAVWTDASEKE